MGSVEPFDPTKPLLTEGYVCNGQGQALKLQPVTLPPLLGTQVEVRIESVGLCHTDIHMRDNDWGTSDYPILLGHEGVGIITHVGSSVRTLREGDRVGIAWMRDSCMSCGACREGRENICSSGYQGTYLGKSAAVWGKSELKYNEMGGCFARVQRIEERFAVKVPHNMTDEEICPLLCGGATMYEPLVNHAEAGKYKRVGIVGFGGLGRCGLKLSKLRGCHTVILSSTASKKEAALQSGADEFWLMHEKEEEEEEEEVYEPLDVIIDSRPCVGETQDLGGVMGKLRHGGVYCRVGIPAANKQTFQHLWIPAVFMQHSVTGSVVTGSKRLNELVRICSENMEFIKKGHSVFDTEVIPFSEINDAMHKLANRTLKGYRYVLKCKSTTTASTGYLLIFLSAITQANRGFVIHVAEHLLSFPVRCTFFIGSFLNLIFALVWIHTFNLYRHHVSTLSPRSTFFLFLQGILITLASYCAVLALSIIPVANNLAIAGLTPVISSILATLFLRDHISSLDLLTLTLNIIGVNFIAWPSLQLGGDQAFGTCVAIIATILASLSVVLVRVVGTSIHYILIVLATGFTGLFGIIPFMTSTEYQAIYTNLSGMLTVVAGCILSCATETLFNRGIQVVRPGLGLIVRSFNIPLSVILGALFLKENVSISFIIGLACVLASIAAIGLTQVSKQVDREQ